MDKSWTCTYRPDGGADAARMGKRTDTEGLLEDRWLALMFSF